MSTVDKLSKLLNQAERAEEGSPEREAFMEKALALSQAYSIDLAVARSHQAKKERIEEPERRQFQVGEFRAKASKNDHLADLMIAICDANDIEVVISGHRVWIWGTGMPSDLDMAERLFAILSVQMLQEADAKLAAGANGEVKLAPQRVRVEIPEDERAWGEHDGGPIQSESAYYDEQDEEIRNGYRLRPVWRGEYCNDEWVKSYPPPKFKLVETGELEEKWVSTVDARVWRSNFYAGFVTRTRSRLREAKKAALKDAGIDVRDDSDDRALALRDKKKEVRDAFEENEKFVLQNSRGKGYGGAEVSSYDTTGRVAGDLAAREARLGNEKDLGE